MFLETNNGFNLRPLHWLSCCCPQEKVKASGCEAQSIDDVNQSRNLFLFIEDHTFNVLVAHDTHNKQSPRGGADGVLKERGARCERVSESTRQ